MTVEGIRNIAQYYKDQRSGWQKRQCGSLVSNKSLVSVSGAGTLRSEHDPELIAMRNWRRAPRILFRFTQGESQNAVVGDQDDRAGAPRCRTLYA